MALDKLTKLTSQSGITTTIDYQMSDLTVDTITVQSGGLKMPVGMSTFQNVTVTGDLTVNGTTTTLDTDLIGVDKLEVSGTNTTAVGIITQAGSGDILRLYDNTTQVFTVQDGGKLLLGTTTPGAAQCDTFTLETSGHTGVTLFSGTSNRGTIAFGDGRSGNAQYRGVIMYDHSDDNMNFVTSDAEKLRITSAGRVGIGITNPSAKLQVSAGHINVDAGYSFQWGDSHERIEQSNSNIEFFTNNTEKMRLAGSKLLLGTDTETNNIRLGNKLGIAGTTAYTGMSISQYAGTTAGHKPMMDFNRSRGSADGTMTSVADNDGLGEIIFRGSDGSNFEDGAAIRAWVDGTPANDTTDMPGRLTFHTSADGDTSLHERLRITSTGQVKIGNNPTTDTNTNLHIEEASGECGVVIEGNTGGAGAYLLLRNNSTSSSPRTYIGGVDAGGQGTSQIEFHNLNDGNNEGQLVLSTRPAGGSMSPRVYITSNGSLLLGGTADVTDLTGDPDGQRGLVIGNTGLGNAGIAIINSTTGAGRIYFGDATGSSANRHRGFINYYHNDSVNTDFMTVGTAGAERLRITSAGIVGINSTSPSGAQLVIKNSDDSNLNAISIFNDNGNMSSSLSQDSNGAGSFLQKDNAGNIKTFIRSYNTSYFLGGNIGIGTGVPDQSLEVFKASGTNLVKVSTQANSTIGIELEKTGATTQSWRIADGQTVNGMFQIYDVTDSKTPFNIDTGQRVLLGSTSSRFYAAKLQVQGASDSNYILMHNTSAGDGDGNRYSKFIYSGTQSGGETSDLAHINAAHDGTADDQKGRLEFRVNTGSSNHSPQEVLRIKSDGTLYSYSPDDATPNIAIRSNDTNWHGYLTQTVHGGTISSILSCGGKWNVDGTTYAATKDYNGSFPTSALVLHNQYDGTVGSHLVFLTKANGSSTTDGTVTERFRINSSGNVGINDTNPNGKLTVKQSGLADNLYKFSCSYRSGNNASGYTASGINIDGSADNSNGEKHTSYINFSSRDPALNGSHGASAWITMSNPDNQSTYGTGQLDFYIRHGAPYAFKNDPQAPSSYWMNPLFTIKSSGKIEMGSGGTYGSSPKTLNIGSRANNVAGSLAIARGEALGGGTGPLMEFIHGPDGGTQRTHNLYSYVGDFRIFADPNENMELRGANIIMKNGNDAVRATLQSGGNMVLADGGFVSYIKSDVNVSVDTHTWTTSQWNTVVGTNVFDDADSIYLVNFKWNHEGHGSPYVVRGNFLWSATNANHTGEVGQSFIPVQAAHTSAGTSQYFQFQGISAGQTRAGLRARAMGFNPSNNNSNGYLEVRATKIADF